jgi:hypothetical protein
MPFATLKQQNHKVIIKFENTPQSEQDVQDYMDKMEKIYEQKKPFVVLYHCTKVGLVKWKYIKMQAKFMRKMEEETKHLLVRAAILVDGNFVRGVLKTLFKLKKPACDLEIFSDIDKAKKYLKQADLHKNLLPE